MQPDSRKVDPFYKQFTNVGAAEFLTVLLLNMGGGAGDGQGSCHFDPPPPPSPPYHLSPDIYFSPTHPSPFCPQPHSGGLKTTCNGVYLQPCPLYILSQRRRHTRWSPT